MKRFDLPFFVFCAMFIFIIPIGLDTAVSIVPGWHTVILTPRFLTNLIFSILLLLATVAYRRLSKKPYRISLPLFIIHLLFTIPAVLFIRFSFLFLNMQGADLDILNRQLTFTTALIVSSFGLFIIGQVLFGVYFIKMTLKKNSGI